MGIPDTRAVIVAPGRSVVVDRDKPMALPGERLDLPKDEAVRLARLGYVRMVDGSVDVPTQPLPPKAPAQAE